MKSWATFALPPNATPLAGNLKEALNLLPLHSGFRRRARAGAPGG